MRTCLASSICNVLWVTNTCYMETSSKVLVETSPTRSGYVYRKTVTTFEKFSLNICNVPWQVWGYKTSWTLNKTLQKSVHVGFLLSLLHVLKMKFKGSGHFQNVMLLRERSRLKHVLPENVIVTFRWRRMVHWETPDVLCEPDEGVLL